MEKRTFEIVDGIHSMMFRAGMIDKTDEDRYNYAGRMVEIKDNAEGDVADGDALLAAVSTSDGMYMCKKYADALGLPVPGCPKEAFFVALWVAYQDVRYWGKASKSYAVAVEELIQYGLANLKGPIVWLCDELKGKRSEVDSMLGELLNSEE